MALAVLSLIISWFFVDFKKPTIESVENSNLFNKSVKEVKMSYSDYKESLEDYFEVFKIQDSLKTVFSDCIGSNLWDTDVEKPLKIVFHKCKDIFNNKPDPELKFFNPMPTISKFNQWDGSYPKLETIIKQGMNDENSYKHIQTRFWVFVNSDHPYIFIRTTFSGKNAFGARVKQTITAKVDENGKIYDINDESNY